MLRHGPSQCDAGREQPGESGSRAATADDGANADETREQEGRARRLRSRNGLDVESKLVMVRKRVGRAIISAIDRVAGIRV